MPKYVPNGISLDLINIEDQFRRSRTQPIVVNDLAAELSVGNVTEEINRLIRTHYEEDELNTLPSCEDGCTSGSFNEGLTCPTCGTKVERVIDKPMTSQVWMRVPEGVEAFINPRFWGLFSKHFDSTKLCLLEYLTDPQYVPGGKGSNKKSDPKVQAIIAHLEECGIERGINFFYKNFDRIMDVVLNPKPFLAHKHSSAKDKNNREIECMKMRLLIKEYRDCIFTRYLPYPSKLLMVSEQGGSVSWVDKNIGTASDAVKTIATVVNSTVRLSDRVIQSRVVKVIKLCEAYQMEFRKNTCGKKGGIFRRQLGSTRSPNTGRATISPISLEHKYDEISTPWRWSIPLLRNHIVNKLLKSSDIATPRAIYRFIDKCTQNSSGPDGDRMEEILNELIAECPEGGLPVSMLRNPTLERLSNQYFIITKINRDTNVNAIMMSVLTIKGPNADFDGDQLQVRLLIDNKEKEQFQRLRSHLGIMSTDVPHEVSKAMTLHPEIITIGNNALTAYRVVDRDAA